MEKINKIVSLDKCRSHRTGLLPFVVFNGDDTINFVSENNPNGNFGGFVYDIQKVFGDKTYEVKYLDIMRYYNAVQEILFDVIYVSGITVNNEKRFYPIDSLVDIKACGGEKYTIKSKYNYLPVDIDDFIFNGIYYTNDDCDLGEYVLINNFSIFKEANEWWSDITSKFDFDFFEKGIWGLCKTVEKNFLGLIEVDEYFEDNVPNFIYYTNVDEVLKKYGSISDGKGGYFRDYLDKKIKEIKYIDSISLNEGYSFKVPTIDIPIFLEDNTVSEKIYTPYMYSVSADGSFYVYEGECVDKSSFKSFTDNENDNDLWVESKLSSLKSKDAYQVTPELWGCFKEFDGDTKTVFYKFEFNNDDLPAECSGMSVSAITDMSIIQNYKCADGEPIMLHTGPDMVEEYKNITILDCFNNFISWRDVSEKGSYIFHVKYENSSDCPMEIPYKVGEIFNITTYDDNTKTCDVVTNIDYDSGSSSVTINYVLGATYSKINGEYSAITEEVGIHYQEELYFTKKAENVLLDGYMNAKLYYYDVDYDTNMKYIYNEELKVGRYVRMAKIIGMEVNNIREYNYPHFTTEGINSLYNNPKYSVDITYNRGAGAAWENHFKLSECNTMEDLENYGNNYFNI